MIEILTKTGTRIGRISDSITTEDIVYVDGNPITLADAYNDPKVMKKFNDEIKKTTNAIKLKDQTIY